MASQLNTCLFIAFSTLASSCAVGGGSDIVNEEVAESPTPATVIISETPEKPDSSSIPEKRKPCKELVCPEWTPFTP